MDINQSAAMDALRTELQRVKKLHPKDYNSPHEGYAILLEEVQELESAVFFGRKKVRAALDPMLPLTEAKGVEDMYYKEAMREEAIQIAVVAIRFAAELT